MTTTIGRLQVVTPADNIPGPKQGHWTYDYYATIPNDGQRYEIVRGVLYMSPSPGKSHQQAVFEIASYLRTHVTMEKLGQVFIAPFDVELTPEDVVQPDVVVLLNASRNKLTSSHIVGTPDLVVEVASPSTSGYDRRQKQDTYAQSGVPEYWVVNPDAQTIEVLVLEGAEYFSLGVYQGHATLPSKIVPGMSAVHIEQFFASIW